MVSPDSFTLSSFYCLWIIIEINLIMAKSVLWCLRIFFFGLYSIGAGWISGWVPYCGSCLLYWLISWMSAWLLSPLVGLGLDSSLSAILIWAGSTLSRLRLSILPGLFGSFLSIGCAWSWAPLAGCFSIRLLFFLLRLGWTFLLVSGLLSSTCSCPLTGGWSLFFGAGGGNSGC